MKFVKTKQDRVRFAEQKIIEYAKQWARCSTMSSYINDDDVPVMLTRDDAAMTADGFLLRLQGEAKLLLLELSRD